MKSFLTAIPFFFLSALFSSVSASVQSQITRFDWELILLGVAEGSLGHEVELAEQCVLESESTLHKIEEAIQEIEQDTQESVKRGIELLGEAMHEAMQDLKDCELAVEDMETLQEMAKALEHPLSFVYHAGVNIIVNRVEIFDEVKTAVVDWRAEPPKYYDFGFNVGEIMKLVLLGESAKEIKMEIMKRSISEWNGLSNI